MGFIIINAEFLASRNQIQFVLLSICVLGYQLESFRATHYKQKSVN